MAAVAGAGLALGGTALGRGPLDSGGFPAYAAGLALAAASSVAGFAALRRGIGLGSGAFTALLLGIFLGRVVLVGVFGLALYALVPAHLPTGLLSLVGFHFVFALMEVALLARTGALGRTADEGGRRTGRGRPRRS